jgi:hypothetical protein
MYFEFPLALLELVTDDVGNVGTRASLSDEFLELRSDKVLVCLAVEMCGMNLSDFVIDEVFDKEGEWFRIEFDLLDDTCWAQPVRAGLVRGVNRVVSVEHVIVNAKINWLFLRTVRLRTIRCFKNTLMNDVKVRGELFNDGCDFSRGRLDVNELRAVRQELKMSSSGDVSKRPRKASKGEWSLRTGVGVLLRT